MTGWVLAAIIASSTLDLTPQDFIIGVVSIVGLVTAVVVMLLRGWLAMLDKRTDERVAMEGGPADKMMKGVLKALDEHRIDSLAHEAMRDRLVKQLTTTFDERFGRIERSIEVTAQLAHEQVMAVLEILKRRDERYRRMQKDDEED